MEGAPKIPVDLIVKSVLVIILTVLQAVARLLVEMLRQNSGCENTTVHYFSCIRLCSRKTPGGSASTKMVGRRASIASCRRFKRRLEKILREGVHGSLLDVSLEMHATYEKAVLDYFLEGRYRIF